MKKNRLLNLLIALTLIVLAACNKSEEVSGGSIEGTYLGTLTTEGLKSTSGVLADEINATTEVTITGDKQIEVHCFSSELDTTFLLNYYENRDSVMVCLTDDDFEHMYGHMLGQGHMSGGMMSDLHNDETEWMHHLNDEHQEGDKHYGGFDIQHHSFGYSFQMMNGETSYLLNFNGIKHD